MKNKIISCVLFTCVINISFIISVMGYEYTKNSNQTSVNELITTIYDSKQQYEDLAGESQVIEYITSNTSNSYWWPIGSSDVEDKNGVLYANGTPISNIITSGYGGTDGFRTSAHRGIDISTSIDPAYIIASKSGVVVYPNNKSQTSYDDNGYYGNKDGGGFGNYVKIQHSDGSFTIYGHLSKDSIIVLAGQSVEQGQVIAKMGNSGSSTGRHLHFEMRDSNNQPVDPTLYVDINNPRPMSFGNSFSITQTSLSKEEFVAKMNNYYERTHNSSFNKNFLSSADVVYDVSVESGVNPELVVVTAGTEQNWNLSASCQYTNNYWGIGITNGHGCNSGGKYSSLAEGIKAYAKLMTKYSDSGEFASMIQSRYEARTAANCDISGHGLPGTLEGMQSIYSIFTYRYNPGSSGKGGCYYLNIMYGDGYCNTVSTCTSTSCPDSSKTTVCEQNDYTAWQLKKKAQLRYDIFGL